MPYLQRTLNILGILKIYRDYDGCIYFQLGNGKIRAWF